MKKYFAFVVMYLAMSWWLLLTALFVFFAMPAKLLVERLSLFTGTDGGTSKMFSQSGFTIN